VTTRPGTGPLISAHLHLWLNTKGMDSAVSSEDKTVADSSADQTQTEDSGINTVRDVTLPAHLLDLTSYIFISGFG
jgi:hypothetical protein